MQDAQPDLINHPPHYIGTNGIEAIDVIEQYGLGFHLGNAVKYLLRAGRKTADGRSDLLKAEWYLERALKLAASNDFYALSFGAHGVGRGSAWKSPVAIADAFALGLNCRLAVTTLLMAVESITQESERAGIDAALEQVRAAIKYDAGDPAEVEA